MLRHKDSSDVIKFMALFSKLKDLIDDTPEYLPDLCRDDAALRDLCFDLSMTVQSLQMNERRRRELFAAPVEPKFLTAWRDYEERFENVVPSMWLADIDLELPLSGPELTTRAEAQWKTADEDAAEEARAIERAIEFAVEQIHQDWRDFGEGSSDAIESGVAAWERLRHSAGLDLRGIMRRREIVPFVLVPRQFSATQSLSGGRSVLATLQQAHDAFVFGAPLAAIALMRSVAESILRDYYNAQGDNFREYINSVRERLPAGASAAALHRLRKVANSILHVEKFPEADTWQQDSVQMEKEIVSLLLSVRVLIEQGPKLRSS